MANILQDLKKIAMIDHYCTYILIPAKYVPKRIIDHKSALVQGVTWHWAENEPLLNQWLRKLIYTTMYVPLH